MNASPISPLAMALIVSGSLFLIAATALAALRRDPGSSFSWLFVAGISYSLLGLAAAAYSTESDGARAAVTQLLAVLLAAAIGVLCPARGAGEAGRLEALPVAAYATAWLTLVGIAPTIGFHGKILIYRSLLAAGWEGVAALAVAGSAAALLPALRALSSISVGPIRGLRAVLVAVLLAAIVALGLYPQAGLAIAAWVTQPAAAA